MDLFNNLKSKKSSDKILILGCGASKQNDYIQGLTNSIFYICSYQNLTISDKENNINLNDVVNYKNLPKNLKLFFPETYKYPTGTIKNSLDDDMFIERFIKVDLLKYSDISKLSKYDYIECRYILHFKCFKKNRINIIKKLFKKLNSGGIQLYYKLSSQQNESYSIFTKKEEKKLLKIFNHIKIFKGVCNTEAKYYTILIKKK